MLAGGKTLGLAQWMELLRIDTARHHGDRQVATGRMDGFGGRISAGRDDPLGPTQRVGQCLLGERQPAGHRDLGAVQYEPVRQLQRRADQSERHGRVEDHEVGPDILGQVVDLLDHPRMREQHWLTRALDAVGLAGIEFGRARVRAGEHGERFGRQATPPFPQQRLDAADLGREVVGDQQVLHGAATVHARSCKRSIAQAACSARIGSMWAR
jgi:hypothetical protein